MSRVVLLLLLLAGCGGGGETVRERAASVQSVEGFSRASPAFCKDWEGVWIPVDADEPCYEGARRVKNLYLHSDEPAKWLTFTQRTAYAQVLTQLPNGSAGYALQITHAQGQNLSPFFYTVQGGEPGSHPASLFASRVDIRFTSGGASQDVTMTGRTWGAAYGSESNNPRIKVTGSGWATLSQTAQQFEAHVGFSDTQNTVAKTPKTYLLARKQFEDVSGAHNPISGEYCPSTDKPGVCWFAGPLGTSRTGPLFDGFTANNGFVMGGGVLSESLRALLSSAPLQMEPEATNLALWSTNDHVGIAVVDSSSNNHPQPAPGLACTSYVLTDPRSGRFVYARNDLKFSGGTITSTTTDLSYFRPGNAVWLHLAGVGSTEPMRVLASGPRALTLDGELPAIAKGQKVNIHRVPNIDDTIMVRRNDGTMHYSKVSGVTLPSIGAAAVDGYQHQSLVVALADPFPCDGINSGRVGNENQPVYYYSPDDLGVTIAHGTGASAKLVRDDSTVQAGLGYLLRHRLVLELKAGSDYAMFDLAGSDGPKGLTTASAYIKTVGGKPAQLNLKAHAGGPYSTPEWQRLTHSTTNVNGTGQVRLVLPAGASVRVAVPQVELGGTASSPIVTAGVQATRAATVVSSSQQ